MNSKINELNEILIRFANSNWDLIEKPAKEWLKGSNNKEVLMASIMQAEKECGSCGCEFDPLYKRALELIKESL